MAMIALLLTAAHLVALWDASGDEMPAGRRRIRVASNWVILVTIPLTAYAFGIATPSKAGVFMLVWLAVMGLLALILGLAGMDLLETRRLNGEARARVRRELRESREDAVGGGRSEREEPGDGA